MAFVQLDDGTSLFEVSVFNEIFEAEREKIKEDEVLIVEAGCRRTISRSKAKCELLPSAC